jgi:16S rRNA processing protein RimM
MTRVCVGVIVGAHGVKGAVKIKCFTERPVDVTSYGPVETEDGQRRLALTLISAGKGVVTAAIAGIGDRDVAQGLRGTKLYVPRTALPPAGEEEFYYGDLVGLKALTTEGADLGVVTGVFDFGGGDVIEVEGAQGARMFSFTRTVVPVVDVAGGRVVIAPPDEVEAKE